VYKKIAQTEFIKRRNRLDFGWEIQRINYNSEEKIAEKFFYEFKSFCNIFIYKLNQWKKMK